MPTYYQCLRLPFLFQEGPSFNIPLVSSLVVNSPSFYLSENYFLKGSRLPIVLSWPVEDILPPLASFIAVEESVVSLIAIPSWVMHLIRKSTAAAAAKSLVVSDSVRPHGLQPTRLLHPWDFPGKSTGVGCHCLLQGRVLDPSFFSSPGEMTLVIWGRHSGKDRGKSLSSDLWGSGQHTRGSTPRLPPQTVRAWEAQLWLRNLETWV